MRRPVQAQKGKKCTGRLRNRLEAGYKKNRRRARTRRRMLKKKTNKKRKIKQRKSSHLQSYRLKLFHLNQQRKEYEDQETNPT